MSDALNDVAWLAQIEASPREPATMLAYSDWLSDQGRTDEAYAWRWMVARGKFPRTTAAPWTLIGSRTERHWLRAHRHARIESVEQLPAPVYDVLPNGHYVGTPGKYRTLQEAVFALARALAECRRACLIDPRKDMQG